MSRFTQSQILALILVGLAPVAAEEIEGRVKVVGETTISIETHSDFIPVAGDKVEILVDIPNVGKGKIGDATVTDVDGDIVNAAIDSNSGIVAVGQMATIHSQNPVRRQRSAGQTESPENEPLDTALSGPNNKTRSIVKSAATLLPRVHLSGHPIDAEIANRTIQLFLAQLDAGNYYFTKSDLAWIEKSADELGNDLRRGRIDLFYEIAKRYILRLNERVELVKELSEFDFDFTIDETLVLNRKHTDLPANEAETRELWRKRVKYELLSQMQAGNDLDEARRLTRQKFIKLREGMRQWNDDNLLESALTALANSFDPHSGFISQRSYKDFVINQQKQLVGIGATLKSEDGNIEVVSIVTGGAADRDGRLRPGDRIVAVGEESGDMVDLTGMLLPEAVSRIRGKLDTLLRLRVVSKGSFEASNFSLKRETIKVGGLESSIIAESQLSGGRRAKVGLVTLPTFYAPFDTDAPGTVPSSTEDLKKVLENFKANNVDIVVLNLQNNGGAALRESINVAGLFLGSVPVLQVKDADGRTQSYSATDAKIVWNGPVVLLTNSVTAGGAEIMVGALQDYGRALVVGDETTFGYGTVQQLKDMGSELFDVDSPPKLGFLKATIQRFYRVTGKSTQLIGVQPDVVLPSAMPLRGSREKDLLYYLGEDAISKLDFTVQPFGLGMQAIRRIADQSAVRRLESEYFSQLENYIESYRKQKKLNQISLHQDRFNKSQQTVDASLGIDESDESLGGYLNEVIAISLDYLSTYSIAQAERLSKSGDSAGSIQQYNRAVLSNPRSVKAHYKLGWTLATHSNKSLRDGKRAVKHATLANEIDGKGQWYYLLALAVAQAEAGNFSEASQRLVQALDKAPQERGAAYEFLRQRFKEKKSYPYKQ